MYCHETEVDLFQAKAVCWFTNLQLVFKHVCRDITNYHCDWPPPKKSLSTSQTMPFMAYYLARYVQFQRNTVVIWWHSRITKFPIVPINLYAHYGSSISINDEISEFFPLGHSLFFFIDAHSIVVWSHQLNSQTSILNRVERYVLRAYTWG